MIGKIIYQIRTQQGIKQSELCRGLCSTSTLSRYENGERRPDWLLVYALLQRLGKSGECFTVVLDLRGYDYLKWRMQVVESLEYAGTEGMLELLRREPRCDEKNILRKQFRLAMQALYLYKKTKEYAKCLELLDEALCCTLPAYRKEGMLLQNVWELNLRIAMLNIYYEWKKQEGQLNQQDTQRMISAIEEMIRFFERKYTSIKEKAKIYPNAAIVAMHLYLENKQYEKAVFHLQSALALLQKVGSTKGVLQLLEGLEWCYHLQKKRKQAEKVKKQIEVLQGLSKQYRKKTKWLIYPLSRMEVHLSNEGLIRERKIRYISRDQFCRRTNLCSAITISRMERGNNFSRRKYQCMAKALGLWTEQYHCDIEVETYEALELWELLEEHLLRGVGEKLHENFLKLERQLDEKVIENRQYLDFIRTMIQYEEKQISGKETGSVLAQILSYTIPDVRKKGIQAVWEKTLHPQELDILVMLAEVWRKESELDRALCLLQSLLRYFTESMVDLRFQQQRISLILQRLKLCYQDLGDEERMEACGQAAVEFCVRCCMVIDEEHMLEHIVSDVGQKLNRKEKMLLSKFFSYP